MKTNNFMHLMAAAAVFAGMVMFTSCNKDDFELPEVIESEVLDEGLSEEIKAETTEQGTKLSYESWIMVKGQTRGAFEDKVSVTLNNIFNNVDTVITLDNFYLGEYFTSVVREEGQTRTEGFVTITDSVMQYRVGFDRFFFSYDLHREVAVYDDHVTVKIMPRYDIVGIEDNGYTLEDLNYSVETDETGVKCVYLNKLLRHSVTVKLSNGEYVLNAKVKLRVCSGPHPAVVKSEFLSGGIVDATSYGRVIQYRSWAEVKHTYSDGKTENKRYETPMLTISLNYEHQNYKEFKDANLVLVRHGFAEAEELDCIANFESIYIYESRKKYEIVYNYFSTDCDVEQASAVFYDGLVKFDFPKLEYTDMSVEYDLKYSGEEQGVSGAIYDEYFLTQSVYGYAGEYKSVASDTFQVIVYK